MSEILTEATFQRLRLAYADATYAVAKGSASAEDDAYKARVGGQLDAAFAALWTALAEEKAARAKALATERARAEGLEAAAREVAQRGCRRNYYSGGRSMSCPEIASVVRRDWCDQCIVAEALGSFANGPKDAALARAEKAEGLEKLLGDIRAAARIDGCGCHPICHCRSEASLRVLCKEIVDRIDAALARPGDERNATAKRLAVDGANTSGKPTTVVSETGRICRAEPGAERKPCAECGGTESVACGAYVAGGEIEEAAGPCPACCPALPPGPEVKG